MKNYLAVFTGSQDNPSFQKWESMDEATRAKKGKEGMEAWQAWAEKYKNRIVDIGGPLSKTKRIDPKGISDIRNQMAAFTIIKAESQEEAAKLFLNHPHFAIFPGDGVEVMEILPVPTM
jgi:hypothetical protein